MAPTKILQYDEGAMERALLDCARGMAVSTAAKLHNVPRSTLRSKVKGIYPVPRKMGAPTLFTTEEEDLIVKWIFNLASNGFPIQKQNFLVDIKKLANELNKKELKHALPSKKWYNGFMMRHPGVAERMSQNLTASRCAVTQEKIKNWQSEVQEYLERENLMEILRNSCDATRVFNCDETAFFLNPKAGRVLAPRGTKCIYTCAGNDEKENITVLMNGNAAGMLAPSMVLFRYSRIPGPISESVPQEWAIGRSESGWMNCETFYEYIANIFEPWLTKNNIVRPVIMFLDGHVSHLSLELSRFASEKQIVLIALLPNATHLLQPCDVALFHVLKSNWLKAVQRFRMETCDQLKKVNFSQLLKKVIDESFQPQILVNGFRTCGLVPWDTNQVKVPVQGPKEQEKSASSACKPANHLTNFFWLESLIGDERLISFRREEYEDKDKGLYDVWLTAKEQCERETEQESFANLCSPIVQAEVETDEQPTQERNHAEVSGITEADELPTQEGDHAEVGGITQAELEVDEQPTQERNHTEVSGGEAELEANELPTQERNQPEASASTTGKPLIPSPFKRALFWPGEKQKNSKKRKGREKIPAVVSSADYQRYFEKKSCEKKEKEEAKEARKAARLESKRQKEERSLKVAQRRIVFSKQKHSTSDNSDSDSETMASLHSSSGGSNFVESASDTEAEVSRSLPPIVKTDGVYVAVRYDGNFFPGIISEILPNGAMVKAMQKSGHLWKWPIREDVLFYEWKDVVGSLNPPIQFSKSRKNFSIPEMKLFN